MRNPRSAQPFFVALLVGLLVLMAAQVSTAQARQEPVPARFVPGEVLIGYTPGRGPVQVVRPPQNGLRPDVTAPDWQAAVNTLRAETGLPVLAARPDYGMATLQVPEGGEAAEIARLAALPWVRYAEPNYIAVAAAAPAADSAPAAAAAPADPSAFYPNDPDFWLQWHAHRVNALDAWAATRGSLSFVVAVLDTGVAQGHPEFAGKLLGGRDYVNDDYDPEDDDPESHGTHVTGIVAAGFNNGVGIAGLAPDVKVLPLKVLDSNRRGNYANISEAIRDAANGYAQVINMSLVGYDYSLTLQDAVNYALSRGRLIVAAAGNCPANSYTCDASSPTAYPAAFPGVLAVAAGDRYDQPAPYSPPKPYVGIAAPGGTALRGIWSTTRWGYGYMYGTSMAAPQVSAAAALAWTLRPAAGPAEIADLLKNSADKVGAFAFSGVPLSYVNGRNDYFGAGRLNMANAVRLAYPPSLIAPGQQSFALGGAIPSAGVTIAIQNPSAQGVYWQAQVIGGGEWLSVGATTGASAYGAPGALTLIANSGSLAAGTYYGLVRLTPLAPAGLSSVDVPVTLLVARFTRGSYAPMAGASFGGEWYDPDTPQKLYRVELQSGNDTVTQFSLLPFSIYFYGDQYQSFQISDNGLLAFGSGNNPLTAPTTCPGDGAAPNNAVYVFAADWVPDDASKIIVHAPDLQTLVVTWQNMALAGSGGRATFQVVIKPDGIFRLNYLSLADPRAGTIGLENESGIWRQRILCQGIGQPAQVGRSLTLRARAPWQ